MKDISYKKKTRQNQDMHAQLVTREATPAGVISEMRSNFLSLWNIAIVHSVDQLFLSPGPSLAS